MINKKRFVLFSLAMAVVLFFFSNSVVFAGNNTININMKATHNYNSYKNGVGFKFTGQHNLSAKGVVKEGKNPEIEVDTQAYSEIGENAEAKWSVAGIKQEINATDAEGIKINFKAVNNSFNAIKFELDKNNNASSKTAGKIKIDFNKTGSANAGYEINFTDAAWSVQENHADGQTVFSGAESKVEGKAWGEMSPKISLKQDLSASAKAVHENTTSSAQVNVVKNTVFQPAGEFNKNVKVEAAAGTFSGPGYYHSFQKASAEY